MKVDFRLVERGTVVPKFWGGFRTDLILAQTDRLSFFLGIFVGACRHMLSRRKAKEKALGVPQDPFLQMNARQLTSPVFWTKKSRPTILVTY